MEWIELQLETTSEASDAICEKLIILGASGITVEDPDEIAAIIDAPGSLVYADEGYIKSLGDHVKIKAYFAKFDNGIRLGIKDDENMIFDSTDIIYRGIGTSLCSVEELLMRAGNAVDVVGMYLDTGKKMFTFSNIADEDWANCWKKYYQPFKISERVVISPSWESCTADEDEVIISLDPGSAFGTGTHATTAMCARLLDETLFTLTGGHDRNIQAGTELRVLDIGCGSGILSIIAAKLGASYVDAIDIDEIAVNVAKENCLINDSLEIIHCAKGEILDIKESKYNIIVANIIAEVISEIASEIPRLLTYESVFIAGGIICTRKDDVLDSCGKAGMAIIKEINENDWVTFLFKNIRC